MNKIYNNLNIENLIKTDWFEQFKLYQKEEILEGLKDNLDVSIYANPEYKWSQMSEIRKGLQDNLNVSIYAKTYFNRAQMKTMKTFQFILNQDLMNIK